MNVRVISVTTLDGTNQDGPGTLYDGITGFLGFVPEIQIGQRMWIYYISGIGSRIHSTKVKGHTFDPQTATHIVTTKNSIYKLLELDYGQNRKKRITSTLYMLDPLGRKFQEGNSDPDGHLLSYGRYPTKIFPSDLPPWYVYGYMYKRHGFMSAKGVKHLLYKPNYTFNHLWKYDTLFISYDKPITPTVAESGFEWYEGYNHCIGGSLILEFVDAAEQYSEYDVSDIRAEFRKKEEWYKENTEGEMDNQNLIRFHGSFEDFAKAYEGQILRYLIYRRMFTPREQEEKYIDESVYEDTHMNTGILREVTRLPDNDYLLGFAVVAEDYAEGIDLECGIEYVKLSEIRLYYYPVDAERYGANEYNGTEQ